MMEGPWWCRSRRAAREGAGELGGVLAGLGQRWPGRRGGGAWGGGGGWGAASRAWVGGGGAGGGARIELAIELASRSAGGATPGVHRVSETRTVHDCLEKSNTGRKGSSAECPAHESISQTRGRRREGLSAVGE